MAATGSAEPVVRHFQLHYDASWEELPPGAEARMWAPLPQNNDFQKTGRLLISPPLKVRVIEDELGNRLLYLEGEVPKNGKLDLTVAADVERREMTLAELSSSSKPVDLERYLKPSSLVPVSGRVTDIIEHLEVPPTPLDSARQLYDFVLDYMAYDKSNPGYGRGDSLFACDARTGNCTDFHSLFSSLGRFRGIPVRFEIGYPLSPESEGEISGYHCWAFFWIDEKGWVPVDISEADKEPTKAEYFFGNIDPNRVSMSTGRDLLFQPQPQSGTVNYFVKPLLEVNGAKVKESEFKVGFRDL